MLPCFKSRCACTVSRSWHFRNSYIVIQWNAHMASARFNQVTQQHELVGCNWCKGAAGIASMQGGGRCVNCIKGTLNAPHHKMWAFCNSWLRTMQFVPSSISAYMIKDIFTAESRAHKKKWQSSTKASIYNNTRQGLYRDVRSKQAQWQQNAQ